MTKTAVWGALFLAISCLGIIRAVPPQGQPDNDGPSVLNGLTEQLMSPVFVAMRKLGNDKRNTLATPLSKKETNRRQYLLVAVLSWQELQEVSMKGQFPDSFKEYVSQDRLVYRMQRMVLLMNDKCHGNDERYRCNKHTEVAAFDDHHIECLLKNFRADNKNKDRYPLILMYSHFIPCAGLPNIPYSCAEEIKNFVMGRHEEFGFIVAYTDVFRTGTDESQSLDHLREAGIPLFRKVSYDVKNYEKIGSFEPKNLAKLHRKTLQQFLHAQLTCIVSKAKCRACIGDELNRLRITAFFVNFLTQTCTHRRTDVGELSWDRQTEMNMCMYGVIDENVGSQCRNCLDHNFQSEVQSVLCELRTWVERGKYPLFLGQPSGEENPFDHVKMWKEPFPRAWEHLYSDPPEKWPNLGHVHCEDTSRSMESLCTKAKNSGPAPVNELQGLSLLESGAIARPAQSAAEQHTEPEIRPKRRRCM